MDAFWWYAERCFSNVKEVGCHFQVDGEIHYMMRLRNRDRSIWPQVDGLKEGR